MVVIQDISTNSRLLDAVEDVDAIKDMDAMMDKAETHQMEINSIGGLKTSNTLMMNGIVFHMAKHKL
jgi:hypothetical protein